MLLEQLQSRELMAGDAGVTSVPEYDSSRENIFPPEHVRGATEMVVGDFDGNGHDDIFFRDEHGNNRVGFSSPHGDYDSSRENIFPPEHVRGATDMVVGDFDGNGHDDIFFRDEHGNNRVGFSSPHGDYDSSRENIFPPEHVRGAIDMVVGDFDGNGHDDIFFRDEHGNNRVGFSSPHGDYDSSRENIFPPEHVRGAIDMVVGDFDGNGHDDIFFLYDDGNHRVGFSFPHGDYDSSRENVFPPEHVRGATDMVVGDLDGNGHDDIFFRDEFGNNRVGFSSANRADGNRELLRCVVACDSTTNGVYDSSRENIFSTEHVRGATDMVVGDLDGNGRDDIFFRDEHGNNRIGFSYHIETEAPAIHDETEISTTEPEKTPTETSPHERKEVYLDSEWHAYPSEHRWFAYNEDPSDRPITIYVKISGYRYEYLNGLRKYVEFEEDLKEPITVKTEDRTLIGSFTASSRVTMTITSSKYAEDTETLESNQSGVSQLDSSIAPIEVTNTAEDNRALSFEEQLDDLQGRYGFRLERSLYENDKGWGEKWIGAANDPSWFLITPDGTLYRWNGAGREFVANLDTSVHANPFLLLDAANGTANVLQREVASNSVHELTKDGTLSQWVDGTGWATLGRDVEKFQLMSNGDLWTVHADNWAKRNGELVWSGTRDLHVTDDGRYYWLSFGGLLQEYTPGVGWTNLATDVRKLQVTANGDVWTIHADNWARRNGQAVWSGTRDLHVTDIGGYYWLSVGGLLQVYTPESGWTNEDYDVASFEPTADGFEYVTLDGTVRLASLA